MSGGPKNRQDEGGGRWKRYYSLGFENPLLRAGAFILFTLLVIRLCFLSPGGRVPEAGTKSTTYYVAPREIACEKPIPNYESLVRKARSEVSPIYIVNPAPLEDRMVLLRSTEDKLVTALAALVDIDARLKERQGRLKEGEEQRIKESPFIQDKKQPEADSGAKAAAQEIDQLNGKSREVVEHAIGLLTTVAPGLTPQEAEAVISALRKSEPLARDVFQAAAMCMEDLRRWLIVETSDIEFQRDRAQGLVLGSGGHGLLPDARVMTYLEALDQMRGRVVGRVISENFPRLKGNRQLVPLVEHLAVTSIHVNLRRDEKAALAARDAAAAKVKKTRTVEFTQGQTILALGDVVEGWQRDCIAGFAARGPGSADMGEFLGVQVPTLLLLLGISALAAVAALALVGFARKVFVDKALTGKDYLALGALLVLHLAVVRVFLLLGEVVSVPFPELSRGVTFAAAPVALSVMLINSLMGGGAALLGLLFLLMTTTIVVILSGSEVLSGNFPSYYILYMLTVCAVGIWMTRRITRRNAYFIAGSVSGASGALFWAVVSLLEGGQVPLNHALQLGSASLVAGALCYLLLVSLIPLFEYLWDYTTDSRLVELASTDHPALKELSRRAPGTYQHSLWLATLAEEAAAAIGANPLLAKVGAYYHDLGKLVATSETGLHGGAVDSPIYFAENQLMGANPHDHLTPEVSARVLRKHVEQSVRMIRKYRLGRKIMDIAAQHHGTTVMEHFFNRARAIADQRGETVRVEDFRYPGPKPQTKEAALVMLADSVEAYVRALPVHTEERITERVREMLNRRMVDGQLDDSALTFRDLSRIQESFSKSLLTMYHARPEYQPPRPDEKTVRLKRDEVRALLDDQQTVQSVSVQHAPEQADAPAAAPDHAPPEQDG